VLHWDELKNKQLKRDRGVSFERIAEAITSKEYVAIVKHPTRANQRVFVLPLDGYVWAVPFVTEDDGEGFFLKTAFPSRKFNRIYGGKKDNG
jgi:uncharacterized DUF497 family protein